MPATSPLRGAGRRDVSSDPVDRKSVAGGAPTGRRWKILLVLASLAAPSVLDRAPAQEALEDALYTAGTTVSETADREWAYVVWDSTATGLLLSEHFAVYAKTGNAAAPGSYVRKAVLGVQTDPTAIRVLLERATHVGDDPAVLDERLRNLFQHLIPSPSIAVEDKLAIVIQGSLNDPDNYENLELLGRLHPGVGLCLGTAYLGLIPSSGQSTLEIRLFDAAQDRDVAVVGRVTVTAHAPLVLPAPGPPFAVPETDNHGGPKPTSAKGHLNVKLRWATPPELRRLSVMNYGFNVYRMAKAVAEQPGKQYHLTPPSPQVLAAEVAAGSAVRLNELPVIIDNDFDTANLANPTANTNDVANFNQALGGDSTTYFLADDNRRNQPGGIPFENGAQFYYFVTARDILGRDGLVSAGGLVTFCDRMPPPPPNGVGVESETTYSDEQAVATQRLKVVWRPYAGTNDTVVGYQVYRWLNPSDVQKPEVRATNTPASPTLIPHLAGAATLSFVDSGLNAPQMPKDAGLAYWYTVRSVDNSACGGNESPDSAPAFGVLRDREGPPAPAGRVSVQCVQPVVEFVTTTDLPWADADATQAAYQLACTREGLGGEAVAWADFFWMMIPLDGPIPPLPTNYLGRAFFPVSYTAGEIANLPLLVDREELAGNRLVVGCRVATHNGILSDVTPAVLPADPPAPDMFEGVLFRSQVQTVRATDCTAHTPVNPGTQEISGIEICASATAGSKEYRLYRRVASGKLTLIKQGPVTDALVCHTDSDLPSSSGILCYYLQLLDEHGNASPLTQLGDCTLVGGLGKLPQPLLAPIERAGNKAAPRMLLQWFCPPAGIERFQVYIARQFEDPPDTIAPDLSGNVWAGSTPSTSLEQITLNGAVTNRTFKAYWTLPVGPAFGEGASFLVDIPAVKLGAKYTVFVRAVDHAGNLSPASNAEVFQWSVYKKPVVQVPWPARDLPDVATFNPGVEARVMPTFVYSGLGVRIGEMPCRPTSGTGIGDLFCLPIAGDPANWLYRDKDNERLFPVVLYRVQVANAFFPIVSHDVVQVSPMMESIAYAIEPWPETTTLFPNIYDPFVKWIPAEANEKHVGLYLVDTQPVVRGARYRYLLVRFDPKNREITQVIPTNEVDVP